MRNLWIKFTNWLADYRCQKCKRVSDISASLLVKDAMCNRCLSKYLKEERKK